jgi:hypothetical protein
MLPGGELDQLVRRFCPECADERPFEQPECLDGHGADCPERACVECGTAILIGPLTQQVLGGPALGAPRVVRPAGTESPAAVPTQPKQPQPAARRIAGAGRAPRSLA